jgi:hypothetical protein
MGILFFPGDWIDRAARAVSVSAKGIVSDDRAVYFGALRTSHV